MASIFEGLTFYVECEEQYSDEVKRLICEIGDNGGGTCKRAGSRHVTHIVVIMDSDLPLNHIIDLAQCRPANEEAKTYRVLDEENEWPQRELLYHFARRKGKDAPPRKPVVIRSEWVDACVEQGRVFEDWDHDGWEVLGRLDNPPPPHLAGSAQQDIGTKRAEPQTQAAQSKSSSTRDPTALITWMNQTAARKRIKQEKQTIQPPTIVFHPLASSGPTASIQHRATIAAKPLQDTSIAVEPAAAAQATANLALPPGSRAGGTNIAVPYDITKDSRRRPVQPRDDSDSKTTRSIIAPTDHAEQAIAGLPRLPSSTDASQMVARPTEVAVQERQPRPAPIPTPAPAHSDFTALNRPTSCNPGSKSVPATALSTYFVHRVKAVIDRPSPSSSLTSKVRPTDHGPKPTEASPPDPLVILRPSVDAERETNHLLPPPPSLLRAQTSTVPGVLLQSPRGPPPPPQTLSGGPSSGSYVSDGRTGQIPGRILLSPPLALFGTLTSESATGSESPSGIVKFESVPCNPSDPAVKGKSILPLKQPTSSATGATADAISASTVAEDPPASNEVSSRQPSEAHGHVVAAGLERSVARPPNCAASAGISQSATKLPLDKAPIVEVPDIDTSHTERDEHPKLVEENADTSIAPATSALPILRISPRTRKPGIEAAKLRIDRTAEKRSTETSPKKQPRPNKKRPKPEYNPVDSGAPSAEAMSREAGPEDMAANVRAVKRQSRAGQKRSMGHSTLSGEGGSISKADAAGSAPSRPRKVPRTSTNPAKVKSGSHVKMATKDKDRVPVKKATDTSAASTDQRPLVGSQQPNNAGRRKQLSVAARRLREGSASSEEEPLSVVRGRLSASSASSMDQPGTLPTRAQPGLLNRPRPHFSGTHCMTPAVTPTSITSLLSAPAPQVGGDLGRPSVGGEPGTRDGIFVNPSGMAMTFCVLAKEQDVSRELAECLITAHGGKVVDFTSAQLVLVPYPADTVAIATPDFFRLLLANGLQASISTLGDRPLIACSYVSDCVKRRMMFRIDPYRLCIVAPASETHPPEPEPVVRSPPPSSSSPLQPPRSAHHIDGHPAQAGPSERKGKAQRLSDAAPNQQPKKREGGGGRGRPRKRIREIYSDISDMNISDEDEARGSSHRDDDDSADDFDDWARHVGVSYEKRRGARHRRSSSTDSDSDSGSGNETIALSESVPIAARRHPRAAAAAASKRKRGTRRSARKSTITRGTSRS